MTCVQHFVIFDGGKEVRQSKISKIRFLLTHDKDTTDSCSWEMQTSLVMTPLDEQMDLLRAFSKGDYTG